LWKYASFCKRLFECRRWVHYLRRTDGAPLSTCSTFASYLAYATSSTTYVTYATITAAVSTIATTLSTSNDPMWMLWCRFS
jgi:hypothetical protein